MISNHQEDEADIKGALEVLKLNEPTIPYEHVCKELGIHFHKKKISANSQKLLKIYRKNLMPMYRSVSWWFKLIEDAVMYGVEQQMIRGRKPVLTTVKKFEYLPKTEVEKQLLEIRIDRYFEDIEKAGLFTNLVAKIVDWNCIKTVGDKRLGNSTMRIFGEAMGQAGQIARISTAFDVVNTKAVKWAAKHTNKLVTNVTNEIKATLRGIISDGVKEGNSIYDIGRRIRALNDAKGNPLIGLNAPQTKALGNFQSKLLDAAVKDGKKLTAAKQKVINRKVATKARRYRNYRMEMIARTETARAVSAGTLAGYKEAEMGKVRFEASGDACEVCSGYDGNVYVLAKVEGMIPVHPNSFAKDTELYTERGFTAVSDIKIEDRCLSLNPETFDLEYVPVINSISHEQNKMIHFHSRNFDLLVTPEHEMFAKRRTRPWTKERQWEFIEAKDIIFETQFYRSSEWRGNENENVEIEGVYYPAELFAEFMGWWLSEGCLVRGRIVIAQSKSKNRSKYDRIVEIAKLLVTDGKVWQSKEAITFKNDLLHEYLRQFGKSFVKHVPQEIKQMSKKYIRFFLDAYAKGDGSERKAKLYKNGKFRNEIVYTTSSKRMADDLGELLIKVGRRPSYYLQNSKGKEVKFRNGTYKINHDIWIVRECYSQTCICDKNTGVRIDWVDYDDMVYCVELEKYHTLMARRNGKVAWCGNCRCCWVPVIESIKKE